MGIGAALVHKARFLASVVHSVKAPIVKFTDYEASKKILEFGVSGAIFLVMLKTLLDCLKVFPIDNGVSNFD